MPAKSIETGKFSPTIVANMGPFPGVCLDVPLKIVRSHKSFWTYQTGKSFQGFLHMDGLYMASHLRVHFLEEMQKIP